MDGTALVSRVGALFAEDFDMQDSVPEPEVIDPVFSAGEVTAAREAAWGDGHAAGLQEAAESDAAAVRHAIAAIARQFASERNAAAARAEEGVHAIAQLLFDALAATFPSLCARHADREVRAILRTVLPGLAQEPEIAVRAHPRTAGALMPEIARLDPELAARVRIVECDALSPGDVRIAWHNGTATRDAAARWQEVAAVLMPAELLCSGSAIRGTVDGD